MSLWRSATADIAANSGVLPWLKASASIASSGQIPVERAHRHRPGYDRGGIAVEHENAGGDRMPIDASWSRRSCSASGITADVVDHAALCRRGLMPQSVRYDGAPPSHSKRAARAADGSWFAWTRCAPSTSVR